MIAIGIDVPLRDLERHEARQEAWLERCPKCCHCGAEIQDDELFDIGGELYHVECAEELFRKSSDDYMEEE